jgi:hypothetical protein
MLSEYSRGAISELHCLDDESHCEVIERSLMVLYLSLAVPWAVLVAICVEAL